MKKLSLVLAAMALAMNLTACGGKETKTETTAAAVETTEAAKEEAKGEVSKPELDGDYSEEQLALAEKFSTMVDDYNAIVERVNASEEVLAEQELVDVMNELSEKITEADGLFADPETLTDEVMEAIQTSIDLTYDFIKEADSVLKEVEGGAEEAADTDAESITVPVEIVNKTGVDIYALALSPANDEDWGENLISEVIADGESVEGELVFTADTLVWDILIQDSEENQATFMGVDFTNASVDGSQLVLSEENGEYFAEVVK